MGGASGHYDRRAEGEEDDAAKQRNEITKNESRTRVGNKADQLNKHRGCRGKKKDVEVRFEVDRSGDQWAPEGSEPAGMSVDPFMMSFLQEPSEYWETFSRSRLARVPLRSWMRSCSPSTV